jgi:hypothetical protein
MDRQSGCYFSFQRCLSLFVLLFILTSCGSAASSTHDTKNSSDGTSSTTDTSQDLQPAYNYSKSQTVAGLFINLNGFICTEGPFLSNLTIASSQLSYDAGSAQIIQNYLRLLADYSTTTNTFITWIPPLPPKELRWVAGSTTCSGDITLTNTTRTTIEAKRFGMQLTTVPVTNSYHYRRVTSPIQCGGCGGVSMCSYQATVVLNRGIIGSHFDSNITSTNSTYCPLPLLIPPAGSAELVITLQDTGKRNIIYTGIPTLEIGTASGEKIITISTFTSSLYFTQTDNLPCYQFQSASFVPCSHSK